MKNKYKIILKKLENIKVPKNNTTPIIILAEKLENGSYQIAETFKNYKRKDFIIENEDKFNNFIEQINQEECTIIIDDILNCIPKPMANKIVLNCTDEELYTIINNEEGKEIGQIIARNLEEITDKKGDILKWWEKELIIMKL